MIEMYVKFILLMINKIRIFKYKNTKIITELPVQMFTGLPNNFYICGRTVISCINKIPFIDHIFLFRIGGRVYNIPGRISGRD